MRTRYLSEVQTLAKRALAHGATLVRRQRVRWDISSGCEHPYTTECYARPSRTKAAGLRAGKARHDDRGAFIVVTKGSEAPLCVELLTPCRECDSCLQTRRRLWWHRAKAEVAISPRTWFGTLTCRPDAHAMFLARARVREARQGVDFDALADDERWRVLEREYWREVTLWLKRLRERYPGKLRQICVTEAHKSGLAHYHLLVHQVGNDDLLKWEHLGSTWPWGFSKWRLVGEDPREVSYVSKYLGKSLRARVRASKQYGSVFNESEIEKIERVERCST